MKGEGLEEDREKRRRWINWRGPGKGIVVNQRNEQSRDCDKRSGTGQGIKQIGWAKYNKNLQASEKGKLLGETLGKTGE